MLNLVKSPSPQLPGSGGPCTVRNSFVGEQVVQRGISNMYFRQLYGIQTVAWQRTFSSTSWQWFSNDEPPQCASRHWLAATHLLSEP